MSTNMRLLFFTVLFCSMSVTAFAQTVSFDPTFNALYSFLLPAIGASAFGLWTDSVKHYKNGTWEWKIFWTSKLMPFLLTVVVAVAVYFMIVYAGFLLPALEALAGAQLLEMTAIGIFGFASRIVEDIIFKKPKSDATS